MKKFISILLVASFLIILLAPIVQATENGHEYTFTLSDGKIIHYFLDKDNMPYQYINGEIIYVALPLEHLKVTDVDILEELNLFIENNKENDKTIDRSVPTNYVDLSQCYGQNNSAHYYRYVTFSTTLTQIPTSIFKLYEGHNSIRLKMTNIEKAHWYSSTNISYNYSYYYPNDDAWYTLSRNNVDCTGVDGHGVQHLPASYPYGRYYIIKNSNLINFDIDVWTSTIY